MTRKLHKNILQVCQVETDPFQKKGSFNEDLEEDMLEDEDASYPE